MYILLLACPAIAATLTVDASGGASYTSIQSAINAARNGDIVRVRPGTYTETIDTSGKNLTIESTSGSSQTTIDGTSGDHVVSVSSGETVTLTGFRLEGGSHGVEVRASTLTAEDITVTQVTGAAPGGGFSVTEGGTLVVDDCRVRNITLTNNFYGGGFYIYEATATISNCTVSGNSAYQGGGAYIWDATVTMTDVDFDGNASDWHGGGLRIRNGSDVTGTRVTLQNNTATNKGGGASVVDSDMDLRNSEVTGNTAGDSGGGLAVENALRNGTVFRGTLSGNTAGGAGGGVYAWGADLELRGTLADNTVALSTTSGAGVYFGDGDLSLVNLDISGHSAYDGGAIYASGTSGSVTASGGVWSDNSASNDGGVLHSQMSATLTDLELNDNTAGGDGGAVFLDEAWLWLEDSTLLRNEAAQDGGAVMVYKAEVNAKQCDFRNNTAGRNGGGLHHLAVGAGGSHATFNRNTFRRNSAGTNGGGAGTDAAKDVTSKYNTFEENSPSGLYVASPRSLIIKFESFEENEGDGFVGLNVDSGRMEGCRFLGNQGDGALFSASGGGYEITTSVFNGNNDAGLRLSATGSGGVTVANIDALGNGTGVAVDYGTGVTVVNAIAIGNDDGFATSSSNPDISYCDAWGNGDDWAGGLGNLTGSNGNLSEDPEYSAWSDDGNPYNDLVYLGSTSPCRDAGDPSLTDPDGSRSDMGSFGGPRANDDDSDGDGYHPSDGDCDESDASVHPGASDPWYDGVDSDCDGADDFDRDGDGYRHESSGDPANRVDCDDTDDDVHPGADDPAGDGVDADCDGVDGEPSGDDTGDPGDDTGDPGEDDTGDSGWWTDGDGDGWAPAQGDCDDAEAAVHPQQDEVCDDGVDNECDGYADSDDAECRGSAACNGCAGAPVGGAWWLLVALVGWARRRR
ncbi:MAG: right-handed parallel beta-helix repeat-containing protein [Alphaproteobacteria bacterium]|nr:right-handed parallel beta-helix repeat-containing protein [Alphaproteobacteria bacterium]